MYIAYATKFILFVFQGFNFLIHTFIILLNQLKIIKYKNVKNKKEVKKYEIS
jgi:hypothetical protein